MAITPDRFGPCIELKGSLPSKVAAISPFIDRLMLLLRRCGCVAEGESDRAKASRCQRAGWDGGVLTERPAQLLQLHLDRIAEILKRDQINIARRTVAKYRQDLGILPSARRKYAS